MNNLKKIALIALFLLVLTPTGIMAQVEYRESAEAARAMRFFKDLHTAQEKVEGVRIQIVATTERRIMEAARRNFLREFPDLELSWEHESPYWKLVAGGYATRREALHDLWKVKKKFSDAILVFDEFKFEDLSY